MPRYYFHVVSPEGNIPDDEGMEFPDLPAALTEAYASARDLLIQELRNGKTDSFGMVVEVRDGMGRLLERVSLKAMVNQERAHNGTGTG